MPNYKETLEEAQARADANGQMAERYHGLSVWANNEMGKLEAEVARLMRELEEAKK